MMADQFDRELELVKLQIAAEDCHTDAQIDIPLYYSSMIVLSIFALSIMLQYSPHLFMAWLGATWALVLTVLFCITYVIAHRREHDGIRKLDGYVEDFKAGKPLPSLTQLCGVKEKK
jgi:hypothetical protein